MDRSLSKLLVSIPVDDGTSARTYPIYTCAGIMSSLGPVASELQLPERIIIITDTNVKPLYALQIHSGLVHYGFRPDIITIPAGERYKTLEVVREVYDQLNELRCGRDVAIVAVGGGVVGDLAGFVAATYYRGVPFVQAPTTLLAQVDSSVGGKVGVNVPYGKNLIGAFYQPRFVFIDTKTLTTLPKRELRSGMAEVIKYGAILDENFFETIIDTFDTLLSPDVNAFTDIIERCCALKASVVEQDERESGYREILNFGHTVGHALETLTQYSVFTHGEAITYGMMAEAHISVNHCGLPQEDARRLCSLLVRLSPPKIPESIDEEQVFEAMFTDKKVRSGSLRLTLINKIGDATFGETPDEHHIKQSIRKLFTDEKDLCGY